MESPKSKSPGGDPTGNIRSVTRLWRYWKTPILVGVCFCALQVAVFLARFGLANRAESAMPSPGALLGMLSGLFLFFVAGTLVGLLARRLLRGHRGAWRAFLLVALAVATPFAVLLSLAGGLLGPPFVVVYALVPYLALVGIPVLIRKAWRRMTGPDGGIKQGSS